MYGMISGVVILSPNRGGAEDGCYCCTLWSKASGVAVVLGGFLALRGSRRRPVAPTGGMAVAVGSTVLRA